MGLIVGILNAIGHRGRLASGNGAWNDDDYLVTEDYAPILCEDESYLLWENWGMLCDEQGEWLLTENYEPIIT